MRIASTSAFNFRDGPMGSLQTLFSAKRGPTSRATPEAGVDTYNTSTHHDASICSLMTAGELQFSSPSAWPVEILHPLEALMRQRIVVLDGAMGTMVQHTT